MELEPLNENTLEPILDNIKGVFITNAEDTCLTENGYRQIRPDPAKAYKCYGISILRG